MATPVVTVADAIVTAINAATFTAPYASITATRKHTHAINRVDHVAAIYVVPKSDTTTQFTRANYERRMAVDIAVIGPCTTEAERLGMTELCEEIKDEIRGDEMGGASFLNILHDPLYIVTDTDDLDQFTAVITANYVTVE